MNSAGKRFASSFAKVVLPTVMPRMFPKLRTKTRKARAWPARAGGRGARTVREGFSSCGVEGRFGGNGPGKTVAA